MIRIHLYLARWQALPSIADLSCAVRNWWQRRFGIPNILLCFFGVVLNLHPFFRQGNLGANMFFICFVDMFFYDKNPSLPGKVASAAKHCRFELRRVPTIHCEACTLGAVGYWRGTLLTFMGCLCFVHVFELVLPEFVARSVAIKMADKKPGDGKDGQDPWERMVDAWIVF